MAKVLSQYPENTVFTKDEITSLAIDSNIVTKDIKYNTWTALFTHNILKEEHDKIYLISRLSPKKQERQKHGFKFEEYVKTLFNIYPCNKNTYTYKWDGILNNYPVSIKLEKKGSDIEMASLFRNFENQEDFYLIVGFWDREKDNIISIETLFIPAKEWHDLFNGSIIDKCKNLLSSITNDVADDDKWKTQCAELKKMWEELTPNLIRLRFKRDHKHQKRMQCAINNKDFYNYFIPKYKKELF